MGEEGGVEWCARPGGGQSAARAACVRCRSLSFFFAVL